MSAADIQSLRVQLTQVAWSARVVVRCLNGGRDLQESSQRAIMLLVDTLDFLHRLKDQISEISQGGQQGQDNGGGSGSGSFGGGVERWLVERKRVAALSEILECFESTMKSMELYFQPGGVGVTYYRKQLLERTFLGRLEQYKVMLLLSMQPDSSERSFLDRKIRTSLKLWREVESGPKVNLQFEERVLGIISQLASEHFITLADLCNRRQQGTGQWIFDNDQYQRWLLGSKKTLYCVGPPGAGKTFLSASIIDFLQRTFTSSDVATVFIFCQEEREKEQTTLDILQNILAQLVYRKRSLSYASSSLYHSESMMKGKASPKVYQNAIRAEVDRFSKVFFVIDGLDMFSDKERLLQRLQKLPDQVQILVTLREVTQLGNGAYVSAIAPTTDLQLYAISRIESDAALGDLIKRKSTPQTYQDVINMVAEKSHGIFLLAKIHLDFLARCTHKSLFERALVHLPQSLGEAYGEAMKQVVSSSPRAAAYVYWVLYALRPLTVGELKAATQSTESPTDNDTVSFEQSIQNQSAGLLTINAVNGTVAFVHRTAKEYLSGSAARVFFPGAQKEIAEACLTAITPDDVVDDCYYNGGNPPRSSGSGFLNYAAMYWGFHAREVHEDEQTIQVLIKTFLNKLLWRRPPLQILTNEIRIPQELGLGKYPQDWTALHILAFFGIVSKSRRLLIQGARTDANDNSFRITPLHCAASKGHFEMAEFLLDNGADGNAMARDGSTALHLATEYGQRKVLKLLLHRPVNPQIANLEGATGLQLAVKTESDEATVPLLVKNKVDVNTRNIRTGDTALHLAIEWRRPRIVLFLLDKGASIDMTNETGLTPLQLAVKVDNCEAISLLLQRRANIEARSLSGFTALQLAAHEKHWIAFDLLVIGGADINAWDKDGESLLHEQARKGSSPSIAAKLLDQGANIEAFTAKGLTPLHCAAVESNKPMFLFLLERGAKPTALTAKGESLLHITLPTVDDGIDILRTALTYRDINVNAVSTEGWTPLHQAVFVGTGAPDHAFAHIQEYINLLISGGADINARLQSANNNAETPLHLAVTAIVPRPNLVALLLSQGADVNAPTADGKTSLHLAAERGRESIFRILYEAGADMSLQAPDSAKADDGHGTGDTAFDLALRNPFGRNWFSSDGKLKERSAEEESVGTLIDEEDLVHDDDLPGANEPLKKEKEKEKAKNELSEYSSIGGSGSGSSSTTSKKQRSRSGSSKGKIVALVNIKEQTIGGGTSDAGSVRSSRNRSQSNQSRNHSSSYNHSHSQSRHNHNQSRSHSYSNSTGNKHSQSKTRNHSTGTPVSIITSTDHSDSPRSREDDKSDKDGHGGGGDKHEEMQLQRKQSSSASFSRNETPYVIV